MNKEIELKLSEIDELRDDIYKLQCKINSNNKYIKYINKNNINHIGFDCSNTTDVIEDKQELNNNIKEVLLNHYIKENEICNNILFNKFNKIKNIIG